MRKQNSTFKTAFISEAGSELKNNDYFGFVELDKFACYVIADGITNMPDSESAKLAIQSIILKFHEHPSMKKSAIRSYLNEANKQLLRSTEPNRLKASVTVVITDYVKMRYGCAGNTRLRLYREGVLRLKSEDMSLSHDLAEEGQISLDVLAQHEERNNLYTYLGQAREFHPFISKKFKLMASDIIALYTRGIWENLDEAEMDDVFSEATDDPQESLDNVEDMLLSKQHETIENYTLAAIFVDRVYIDPNRKRRIKMIVTITVIVLVIALIVGIVLFIIFRKRAQQREDMNAYYASAVEYINDDNYISAKEDAKKAYDLAKKLRDDEMIKKLEAYVKLTDSIIKADEFLLDTNFKAAQSAFLKARGRSRYADNNGLDYILENLQEIKNYMDVYDLIAEGDLLASQGNLSAAELKYNQAKKLAAGLYFAEGKQSAMDGLEKIYADLSEEEATQKEAEKKASEESASAAALAAQGDKAMLEKDYAAAQTNYTMAKEKFEGVEDSTNVAKMDQKLAQAAKKLEDQEELKTMAEQYVAAGEEALKNGDPEMAQKYYDMAKKIYADLGLEEMAKLMDKKLEMEDPEAAQAIADAKNPEKAGEDSASDAANAEGSGEDAEKEENAEAEEEEKKKQEEDKLTIKEHDKLLESAEDKEERGDELFDEGDFLGAKRLYREARDIYKKLDMTELADSMQEKMDEAQLEYDKVLEQMQEEKKELLRQAQNYADLGDDAKRAGDIEQAIIYYRRARDIYMELDRDIMVQLMQDRIDALINTPTPKPEPDPEPKPEPDPTPVPPDTDGDTSGESV